MKFKRNSSKNALIVVILYTFMGLLWIIFSDSIVSGMVSTREELEKLQTVKGFFYVFITAFVLYVLVYRLTRIQEYQHVKNLRSLRQKMKLKSTLSETQSNYFSLLDNMPMSMANCRMIYENGKPVDYQFLSVNKAYEEFTGLYDVHSKRINAILPGYAKENPDSLETFDSVIKNGKPLRWEHYLKILDQWYLFTIYSTKKGEFTLLGLDITDQKKMLSKLEEQKKILRRMSQIAKIGGWEFDAVTKEGHWTDELAVIHDMDPSEEINVEKGLSFYTPESRKIITKAIAETLENGKFYDLELEIISAKGVRKWVRTTGIPVQENGRVVRVEGILQDITELKSSELSYKQLFESSRDALVTLTPLKGTFSDANQAALDLFGIKTKEEILKLSPANLSPQYQPDGTISSLQTSIMMQRALQMGSYSFEWVHKRTDGSTFYTEVLLTKSSIGDEEILQASIRDISERKLFETEILSAKEKYDHLAHIDTLTGLPNRLSLNEFLDLRCFDQRPFAFLFCDIDHFQSINDSYGHHLGDSLLKILTSVLREVFSQNAHIFRTGGDEFAIILESSEVLHFTHILLKRLHDILDVPLQIDGVSLYVTLSTGVTIFPDNTLSRDELLLQSDAAMYEAKKEGRNTYRFYDDSYRERALERTNMTSEIKEALRQNIFKTYYQPQINPMNGEVVGVEALIRWFKDSESIPPYKFIPVAEESGLILEIGAFVLKQSFLDAVRWDQASLYSHRIAVNVSAFQFNHPDFMSVLDSLLTQTRCRPSLIELEITESSLISNPNEAFERINTLQHLGFHISIDDFGTGYSSLSYIKNFALNKLKIDQSFIRDIHKKAKNQTIVKAIIALSKGLEINVLAEGVENAEEMEFLLQNGIDSIQGYYYHKPMDAASFEALLFRQKSGG